MSGIWSIAKHTFAQCVRMKLAAAFVVLLAAALLALPTQMTGDGTLAGQIRAFLAYGTGISMLLLSAMTIFVGASLVSDDIRTRQIFSIAVKPVARWQYVLGRWAGLVMFDAVLLALACTAIYATAAHMRTKDATANGKISLSDRRAVETEVFASRRQIRPRALDIDAALADRVAKLKNAGEYQAAMEGWLTRTDGDRAAAEERLLNELQKQISVKMQSIAPIKEMEWRFDDIAVAGREIRRQAHIAAPLTQAGLIRIRTREAFSCRLRGNDPIKVNGFDAYVTAVGRSIILVHAPANSAAAQNLANLDEGDAVEITIEPVLQITYVVTPTNAEALHGGRLNSWWRVRDPEAPTAPWMPLPDTTGQKVTLSLPSRLVGKNASLQFDIRNESPTSLKVLMRDISLLYNVDTFENNFVRASLLMLCQLAYLAAVSVFAGSFVSFPVACLLCLTLIPFSLAREFLSTSLKILFRPDADPLLKLLEPLYTGLHTLLPNFARTMPGDRLVDGMDISWAFVGQTALSDVLIRSGVAILLACFILHRRELARVQV